LATQGGFFRQQVSDFPEVKGFAAIYRPKPTPRRQPVKCPASSSPGSS